MKNEPMDPVEVKVQPDLELKRQCERKATIYQLQMCFLANLTVLGPAMVFGYSAVALPPLQASNSEFEIDANQASWIASGAAFSIPFGCLITSFVMRSGRKSSFLIISAVSLVGWLTIYLSANVEQIIIGRILSGVATGLATVPGTVYAAEVASPKWRSTVVTWTSIGIAAGVLVVYIFGFIFPDNWRMVALLCAIFPLVAFWCTLIFMPESPVWLREKGRILEATKVLRKFRGVPTVEDLPAEVEAELQVSPQHKKRNLLKHLLRRSSLIPLLIMMSYFFFQQFSGIFAIVYYAVKISKDSGLTINDHVGAILIGTMRLIGTLLIASASRRFGRRPLSIISGSGMTLSMGSLSLCLFLKDRGHMGEGGMLPVVCLMTYIFMSTLGFLVLPFAMLGELYPPKVKDVLSGMTTCVAYIFSFVTVKAYPDMFNLMGKHGIFFFYALFSLLGTLFVIFFLPETKGRTLLEIENFYVKREKGCSEESDKKMLP